MANLERIEDRPAWNNMNTPKIMERMQELFETSKWHDCVFKLWKSDGTGEELVYAHNLILASSSPVFEALCYGPLAEENPIEIPDIDPQAFRMMLKFIYTDCIEFTSVEMACNVLYASKKYLIYSLAGLAISYISCHINESNCLQVYDFASFVQEEVLIKESWSYLCSHLDSVIKYFNYESLTTDLVKKLVNEEALNGDEILVYQICYMWAEAECENNNLEKTGENLRTVLIKADILNKIRWFTLSIEDFEGPKKSGILTNEEVKFISKILKLQGQESDGQNFQDMLLQNYCYPFSSPISTSNIIKKRKEIHLKRFYCHRFIEREIRPALSPQNDLKISTYITANKTVRLTAIFINAKILPLPQLNTAYSHTHVAGTDYNEKLAVHVFDSDEQILFTIFFIEKVCYGTVFKISFHDPVILERDQEYKIQVDLLQSTENYLFGVRNCISKFPSGLCVSFREKASIGKNGRFVDASELSIISGLELCL